MEIAQFEKTLRLKLKKIIEIVGGKEKNVKKGVKPRWSRRRTESGSKTVKKWKNKKGKGNVVG